MDGTLSRRDWLTAGTLGAGVLLLYALTFGSVPTSDGLSWIGNIEWALENGRLPIISNAPFSHHLVLVLKRASVGAGVPVPTLWIFQGLNAAVSGLGAAALYLTIRRFGGRPYWAIVGSALVFVSYAVWYFANGEVHHVGLAILLWLFYLVTVLRRRTEGPIPVAALIGLGLLNAVAVFFHQEHFIFGFVVVTLLLFGRPWRRGLRESLLYTVAGSAGTFVLIYLVGRFLVGARTLRDIGAWYFWQLGYLVRDYVPESAWLIGARLVKGQLTALLFGVQVVADAARQPALWHIGEVRAYATLTGLALLLAAALAWEGWCRRRDLDSDTRALAAAALVWLSAYPILLSWYFPAVTEYYLKTVPPVVLLLVLGPITLERAGLTTRRLRVVGALLLALVFVVNGLTAIAPWYRYGRMRERIVTVMTPTLSEGDLAVSAESGLDAVLEGHLEQIPLKDFLYRDGKRRGFETVETEIDARLRAGHRVYVYNLMPSRWTLEGLNAPDRNPYRDRYEPADFEALLARLRSRFELVPVLRYWEESKEPLYLFGRRTELVFEVRRRS
ncbi:MAG TPA: hypothetical protein VMT97_02965 [Terriglobales bacterium]|nr:hypothetical protein [Terriglobales bacterium]